MKSFMSNEDVRLNTEKKKAFGIKPRCLWSLGSQVCGTMEPNAKKEG